MILRQALEQLRGAPAYAGHLSDGSSVQKHSAGDGYPFIVRIREDAARNTGYAEVFDSLNVVHTRHIYVLDNKQDRMAAYRAAADSAVDLAQRKARGDLL